jgi:hypothetical protein
VKLSIVSTDPIGGGKFVNTARFPKLGFVRATPDLVVTEIEKAEVQEQAADSQGGRTNWSFEVDLRGSDARLLGELTATNVPCRVLIQVDDKILAAPLVTTPIANGRVAFECSDPEAAREFETALSRLRRNAPRN